MLYLAEVTGNLHGGGIEIQLLAHQKSDKIWKVCSPETVIIPDHQPFNEGVLILVTFNPEGKVLEINQAKSWILNLVKNYLTDGVIDMEEWLRQLTSQSQELTQMRLEIETRREQLQELEENFNLQRKSN